MFIFSDFSNGRCVAKFINKSVICTFSYSGYFTTVASLCIVATVSSSIGAKGGFPFSAKCRAIDF